MNGKTKLAYGVTALLLTLSAFLFTSGHSSDIVEALHFEEVHKRVLKASNKDTLVLFDVDDVLIRPTDSFLFRSPIRKKLKKDLDQRYGKEKTREIISNFFLRREVQLVNDNMPKLLTYLQSQQIPTTALSAWWTGKFGTIDQMEKIRFQDLDQVKISFKETSPFKEDALFQSHKTSNGGTPMINSGIIFSALASKGEVLELALDRISHNFKNIVFIDDQMHNLNEVKAVCDSRKINFLGIHYREAESQEVPELIPSREELRFDILEKEHRWLLDHELDLREEQIYLD